MNAQSSYISSIVKQMQYYKSLGEKAMAQVSDDELFYQPNSESNSIATIVHHIAGNMLSRFTDFLTSDGEKPWRNRDAEFESSQQPRTELTRLWEDGWKCLFLALSNLTDSQLENIVYIRNDGHTVIEAINRQLAHYSYHIGQIVYIAKMTADQNWKTLSIARNKSVDYNERKFTNDKSVRHYTEDL